MSMCENVCIVMCMALCVDIDMRLGQSRVPYTCRCAWLCLSNMSIHVPTLMSTHRHREEVAAVASQLLVDRVVTLAQQSTVLEIEVHLDTK